MTLMSISPGFRATLCFFTIVLFLLYTVDIMQAFRQKNRPELTLSVVLFLCTYAIHQIVKSVIIYRTTGHQEAWAQFGGSIPVMGILLTGLFLLGIGLVIFYRLLAWRQSHITPASVKESIDNLPSGLAFYDEEGSCLLVNHTMNRISTALTGHAVTDGYELQYAAENHGMSAEPDGRKYQIYHRRFAYGEAYIHELVADDVTELHEKTGMLSSRNAELADMNRRLKQYRLNMDESVRKQEILQAKVQIHDEMNRLLLATDSAAEGTVSTEDLQKILRTWKNNALLLCKEADAQAATNTEQDLQTLADIIGIKPEWDGRVESRDPQVLQLFELATGEAMSNAVKHANAEHLYIKVRESETELMVTYTNDGNLPHGDVYPAGGLKNLSHALKSIRGGTYVH